MLTKCANPSCSTPLVYLREGKIFMIESAPQASQPDPVIAVPKSTNRVEHFWLCGPCSLHMTLAWDRQMGVQVVPKASGRLRAIA